MTIRDDKDYITVLVLDPMMRVYRGFRSSESPWIVGVINMALSQIRSIPRAGGWGGWARHRKWSADKYYLYEL